MGASMSNHIKVFGNCYDVDPPYTQYDDSPLVGLCFLIISMTLLGANFITSFKNMILLICMILSFVWTVYCFTLRGNVNKWWFARKNGKKVPCPKPKPECDEFYKKNDTPLRGPDACDERFKYE